MRVFLRLERLGLIFFALMVPLAFYPFAEDAYRLTQVLALALAVPALCAYSLAALGRPFLPFQSLLVVLFFAWRLLTHRIAGLWDLVWICEQFLYLVLYFWAAARLGDTQRAVRFKFWLLTATALAALYGIAQSFGADPLAALAGDPGFGRRAYASMGNPIFWAGFLIMVLPLALLPLLEKKNKIQAGVLTLVGLFLLALLFTQTRGAWLGFVFSMVLIGWRYRKRLALKRVAALTAAGLVFVFIFSVPGPHNPQDFKLGTRLVSTFSSTHQGATGRFFMWRAAAQAALDKPLFGNGGGGFTRTYLEKQAVLMALPEHKDEPYRYTNDAHNDWLQLAAESGLPALVMLVLIFWLSLKRLWRQKNTQSAALAAALLALAVNAVFNFPMAVVPSAALMWVFLGWASARPHQDSLRLNFSLLRLIAGVMVLVPAFVIAPHFVGSSFLNAGMNYSLSNNPAAAEKLLTKAAAMLPDERAYNRLGLDYDKRGQAKLAAQALQLAIVANPASADSWANLCLVQGKAGDYLFAKAACLKALYYNPRSKGAKANLANIYVGLAVQALQHGEKKLALKHLGSCLQLKPNHQAGRRLILQLRKEGK